MLLKKYKNNRELKKGKSIHFIQQVKSYNEIRTKKLAINLDVNKKIAAQLIPKVLAQTKYV